jgi:hypothetical protein
MRAMGESVSKRVRVRCRLVAIADREPDKTAGSTPRGLYLSHSHYGSYGSKSVLFCAFVLCSKCDDA